MQTWVWPVIVVIIIIVVLAVVAGALRARAARQQRQSQHLQETFGPEYERAVSHHGSQDRAEADLLARQKHVEALNIRPLAPADRDRYVQAWRATQARFVDEPVVATAEADRLVADLMSARGYPVRDFEQRADDISVHHPQVVENYRAAHATSLASAQGQASTEDLRTAMIHYRALFDELLQTSESDTQRAEVG
jgi:hypothetical protein